MTVYVDAARHPLGRMLMCHMLADSTQELLEMADRIGINRRHLQKTGTATEHFDICKAKRAKAIKYGALAVTGRELVILIQRKRAEVGTKKGVNNG